ncbi:MAG: purine nucleoside permease [Pseudomonadota bacterium]
MLTGCEKPTASVARQVIEPKIVIVTMFERGADTGDAPGEFQFWRERRELDTVFESGAHHDIHYNADSGILAIVTGIGTAKAAASVMALGMDPRFDLSHSYWLVAGIAGFDPEDASIGSAAWAEYLVDGDIAHHIDAREKPDDWEWGYIERHVKTPFQQPRRTPNGEVYQINSALANWAFEMTKDIELADSAELAEARARYTEHPNAQKPPFVLKGDHLAASTFWHGEILNDWANAWVSHWSEGNGDFVSSAMEETGTMQSMTYLDRMGRVDRDRVMVLRTASNYTMPPPGISAADNLLAENDGYSGLVVALESGYAVGSVVIDALLSDWDTYRDRIPGSTR